MANTSVTIRPATADDLPAVAGRIAARNSYWRGTVPDDRLDARAAWLRREAYTPDKLERPRFALLVADQDDPVVGFALIGPPHDAAADPARVAELRLRLAVATV